MPVTFTEYALAAGFNNAAGLTKIGTIVPSSHIAFPEPTGPLHNYEVGIVKPRLDKILTIVGFDRHVWLMSGLTFTQYKYLQTTYCGGGVSGKVTIKTRWHENNYANYNAVLHLQYTGLERTLSGFSRVELAFVDLDAL